MADAHARPRVGKDGHVLTLASSPEPGGVTSNIGHPREPAVIGVSVDGARPFVTISVGSGHLGSGSAMWLEQVLDDSHNLQPAWIAEFTNADAMWLAPYLARLAAGEDVAEQELIEAYTDRHGHAPEKRQQ